MSKGAAKLKGWYGTGDEAGSLCCVRRKGGVKMKKYGV